MVLSEPRGQLPLDLQERRREGLIEGEDLSMKQKLRLCEESPDSYPICQAT